MIPDFINGAFELMAGVFTWWNVYRIRKDKQVQGMSLVPLTVFWAWGYWNIYYYLHLNQTLSWVGGISVVVANTTWMIHILYYKYWKTK